MEKILFKVKDQKYDFSAIFCDFQQNGKFEVIEVFQLPWFEVHWYRGPTVMLKYFSINYYSLHLKYKIYISYNYKNSR